MINSGDPQFVRYQDQSGASLLSLGGGPRRGNAYLIEGVSITDIPYSSGGPYANALLANGELRHPVLIADLAELWHKPTIALLGLITNKFMSFIVIFLS